jgi:hypothetical protein
MAAEDADVMQVGDNRVAQESPPVHEIDDESNAHPNGLQPSPMAAADEDDLDDLDDMEFILDEIENRIAPLA